MGIWSIGALGVWGNEDMGISIPGDVSHYLIWHFYFIASCQYDARCPSFLGLWSV